MGTLSRLEVELPPPPPKEDNKKLSWWGVVATQTTFSTSGALVSIPFAFGQIGYVLGPMLLVGWAVLCLGVNCWLVDVALDANCRTLPEVGRALAGDGGRRLVHLVQMANLIVFLPVVLNLTAGALQYVADTPWDCIGYWNILCAGGLFGLLQVLRRWSHASWLAYATCCICLCKATSLLPYAYVHYKSDVQAKPTYASAWAFGAPENSWGNWGLALACFPYAITPVFIVVETLAEAREPERYKSALVAAAGCMCAMYLVAGLVAVQYWGWDLSNPVTLQVPRGWVGITLNVFLAMASMLDYVIASLVVNREVARLFPEWPWVLQSLPSTIVAVVLVCSIPSFGTLVGILTGFTIVGANTFVVTLCWTLGSYDRLGSKLLHLATVLGVPLSGYVIAASVKSAMDASYASNFFCDG